MLWTEKYTVEILKAAVSNIITLWNDRCPYYYYYIHNYGSEKTAPEPA